MFRLRPDVARYTNTMARKSSESKATKKVPKKVKKSEEKPAEKSDEPKKLDEVWIYTFGN